LLALPASAGQSGRAALTAQAQPSGQLQSANGEYVVAYADGVSTAAARAAVKAAGGTILKENAQVGVATVRSSNLAFVRDAAGQRALVGAAATVPSAGSRAAAAPRTRWSA
jgi:lantibiotic leader peptide-processing serine protease